jgi:DNA-binding transcriptional MerR regulator
LPKADKTPADAALMRISAAAKAADVSVSTLEYYLMLGLVEPLRRPGRPGRYFDDASVRRIRLVRRLNRTGMTLRWIREVYFNR